MPFETFDRSPPPLFQQGPSAFSRLVFFSALALLLMAADARLHLVQPLRLSIAAALHPAQWLARQPVEMVRAAGGYVGGLKSALAREERAQQMLAQQSLRAAQVEYSMMENERLRALLGLLPRLQTPAQAAQVIYHAGDIYSRRAVIDRGQVQGVAPGSPVMDENGVLGQVTRVYPWSSEVTLLSDRDQVAPVVNARTGQQGVLYGSAQAAGAMLELRYTAVTEDVREGDLLVTSGVDGVYPSGLPVARVAQVERSGGNTSFAYILCEPQARLGAVAHVMVLAPATPLPAGGTAAAAPKASAAAAQASTPAPAAPAAATPAASRAARARAPRASRPAAAAARASAPRAAALRASAPRRTAAAGASRPAAARGEQ